MIIKETIRKILEASVNAPSGSNSQPWRFEISGNQINVIAEPKKDHPILNYQNRGTWLAHGALIENVKIAAAALGWRSEIEIFPDRTRPNLTARIGLLEALSAEEELFQIMPRRVTNRGKYDLWPLTTEQKKYLEQSADEVGGEIKVVWTEDRIQINRLGQAAAANEIITLENQKLHDLFFDEVVWTREEEKQKMKGLLVETMGLKSPEKLGLRLFKHWPIMKIFAKLGIARKIAAGNAKNYAATPIAGLMILKNDDRNFLAAGRVIERIWLKATRLGFGFHLITGTMFYWQGTRLGDLKLLSVGHQRIIDDEYRAILDIADIGDENWIVTAMFRVGRSDEPTAYSTKKPPEIKWL